MRDLEFFQELLCRVMGLKHGDMLGAKRYGSGHIHETFLVQTKAGAVLVQRLNQHVFGNLAGLMSNVARVCEQLVGSGYIGRVPQLLYSNGSSLFEADDGSAWRAFSFLENSQSHDQALNLSQAENAAGLVGSFLEALQQVSGLIEVIPGFQDFNVRLKQLEVAVKADSSGRLKSCQWLVDELYSKADVLVPIAQWSTPIRNTHGDLKFNNILFDRTSGQAVAVVDLDTCGPGKLYFDFGDFLRAGCATAPEDDFENMGIDEELLKALTRGFFKRRGIFETNELEQCCFGGELVSVMLASRFLTDFLNGDRYFPISYTHQNLNRAQAQLVLAGEFSRLRGVVGSTLGI